MTDQIGPVESTLRGIRELLADESRWIRGNPAVTRHGDMALPWSTRAVAWCWVGASMKLSTCGAEAHIAFRAANEFPVSLAVGTWNDAPERTHAEVLEATDRAIAYAQERGL